MLSLSVYKVIHIFGVLVLFLGYGVLIAAFSGSNSG